MTNITNIIQMINAKEAVIKQCMYASNSASVRKYIHKRLQRISNKTTRWHYKISTKLPSMWVRELVVIWRYLCKNLLRHLNEVACTASVLRKNSAASSNDSKQYSHDDGIFTFDWTELLIDRTHCQTMSFICNKKPLRDYKGHCQESQEVLYRISEICFAVVTE